MVVLNLQSKDYDEKALGEAGVSYHIFPYPIIETHTHAHLSHDNQCILSSEEPFLYQLHHNQYIVFYSTTRGGEHANTR